MNENKFGIAMWGPPMAAFMFGLFMVGASLVDRYAEIPTELEVCMDRAKEIRTRGDGTWNNAKEYHALRHCAGAG